MSEHLKYKIQNYVGGILEFLNMRGKSKTCLSMGTGSAFKDGGLKGDGLKAVLATAVVFGRACGAASTTFSDSKITSKWNQK